VSLRPELLDSADLPAGFGRFELVSVLGAGGMGRVFQARLRGPGLFSKDLALKIIHCAAAESMPDLREGLQREARLGALLRHPNLVDVYDCGEDEGQPWLAMELIGGGSIQERLAEGPLDPAVALALAAQTAAGLAYMHELVIDGVPSPLVHRDLKPANVMLHFENAKIADYGLARPIHGTSPETWSDAIAGTPAYMAPEQVAGRPLDGRSDLFALGAMLYEMLTGTRFLQGRTVIELVYQIIHVDA
jgi:serine/threonine protein kinase